MIVQQSWKYILFFLLATVVGGRSESVEGIELELTRSECWPGDMVELHVRMKRSDFAELEVKVPKHESLHLVSQQPGAMIYEGGFYRLKKVWVFQPTQAGLIELNGITAMLKRDDQVREVDLPSQRLRVNKHDAVAGSLTPMALPVGNKPATSGAYVWIACGVGAGLLLHVILVLRKRRPVVPIEEETPVLKKVLVMLEAGEMPSPLIEQLLDDRGLVLSTEARAALQKAVYHGPVDRDALMEVIRKEGGE